MVMNSRERVRTALRHEEPDRVPMNYHGDSNMSRRLREHFGLEGNDSRNCWLTGNEDPRLLAALDCDLRTLVPDYVGPPIGQFEDGSFISVFGEHLRIVENDKGAGYFLYPSLPLADAATAEEVDAHPWPSVDWFDFGTISEQMETFDEFALVAGDMGTLDCLNRCLTLFGHDRVMIGLALQDPALLRAFEHISDFYYAYMTRFFEAGKGRIDIAYYGEDLGTQRGPRIGLDMYRALIRPLWTRHLELAHSHGCALMQHCCGSAREYYPEFIDMGIQIHDTVQLHAARMAPDELKKEFGAHLCFHGGISIQNVLETGTPESVAEEVRRVIDALAPDGGYIMAPAHWVQSGTPVENVVTMYQVAKEYSTSFYEKRRT